MWCNIICKKPFSVISCLPLPCKRLNFPGYSSEAQMCPQCPDTGNNTVVNILILDSQALVDLCVCNYWCKQCVHWLYVAKLLSRSVLVIFLPAIWEPQDPHSSYHWDYVSWAFQVRSYRERTMILLKHHRIRIVVESVFLGFCLGREILSVGYLQTACVHLKIALHPFTLC